MPPWQTCTHAAHMLYLFVKFFGSQISLSGGQRWRPFRLKWQSGRENMLCRGTTRHGKIFCGLWGFRNRTPWVIIIRDTEILEMQPLRYQPSKSQREMSQFLFFFEMSQLTMPFLLSLLIVPIFGRSTDIIYAAWPSFSPSSSWLWYIWQLQLMLRHAPKRSLSICHYETYVHRVASFCCASCFQIFALQYLTMSYNLSAQGAMAHASSLGGHARFAYERGPSRSEATGRHGEGRNGRSRQNCRKWSSPNQDKCPKLKTFCEKLWGLQPAEITKGSWSCSPLRQDFVKRRAEEIRAQGGEFGRIVLKSVSKAGPEHVRITQSTSIQRLIENSTRDTLNYWGSKMPGPLGTPAQGSKMVSLSILDLDLFPLSF